MLELLQLVNLNLKSFFSHMYSIIVSLSNVDVVIFQSFAFYSMNCFL